MKCQINPESKGNFDLEEIISKLEGLRTRVIYDSPYAMKSLLFCYILPHFSSKNLYIAVYSDTMCRNFEKTYQSIARVSPDVAKLLDKSKVIKIGMREDIAYGKLCELIYPDSDWFEDFVNTLMKLDDDDFLLFHGFSMIPLMYGPSALRFIQKTLDSLPEDITLVVKQAKGIYDGRTESLIKAFYDVVLKVERCEEIIEFDETYEIGIDHSIIIDVRPRSGRFKVGEYGKLVMI
jgi:hypothetical protein